MDTQAQAIAKEFGGEVLCSRIEGNEIVVLLVDGRKIRRPLAIETEPRIAKQFEYIEEAVKEQTAPPVSVPNQHQKKGKGK